MPINRERAEQLLSYDSVLHSAEEFLEKNKDQAYTAEEIIAELEEEKDIINNKEIGEALENASQSKRYDIVRVKASLDQGMKKDYYMIEED